MSRLICFTTASRLFLNSFILATAIFAAVLLSSKPHKSKKIKIKIKINQSPSLLQNKTPFLRNFHNAPKINGFIYPHFKTKWGELENKNPKLFYEKQN